MVKRLMTTMGMKFPMKERLLLSSQLQKKKSKLVSRNRSPKIMVTRDLTKEVATEVEAVTATEEGTER